jgi:signal transduction histidine kinase
MPLMRGDLRDRYRWFLCIAALVGWLAIGWPVLRAINTGEAIRGEPVSALWLVPFCIFGAAAIAAIGVRLGTRRYWLILCLQVGAVMAMAIVLPWAGMSPFLVIVAWQAAMATGPEKSLGWVAGQTLAVIGALMVSTEPDLCWVITKSVALQLCFVFAAQALRREAGTAQALALANEELRAAQAVIARSVRDAERLRISRELHDAWGHELTALGLQLEIASHVAEPGPANAHVVQAKGLARDLLGKVRDVVSTLREAEGYDLCRALDSLARSVPVPAVHLDIAPDLRVGPDQVHALVRCAQEAITNAVRHARAGNLWLSVSADGDGIRLIARDDGEARLPAFFPGSGLVGMRERVETLGGKLALRADTGFTVDAWLPARAPQSA